MFIFGDILCVTCNMPPKKKARLRKQEGPKTSNGDAKDKDKKVTLEEPEPEIIQLAGR